MDKKFSDMTLTELIAERAFWDEKVKSAIGWGASLAAAHEFRQECDRELARRKEDA